MTTRKRITLEDVSRAAGVSLSTVSMILSNRPDVSFAPETIKKVRHAAEVLGYRASTRIRPTMTGRNIILIVSPNISNAYYSTMAQAIQQSAEQQGFSTLIFTNYRSAEKEDEALRMALEIGVRGIIFTMMPQRIQQVENINRSIPIVVIGDRNTSLSVDTVEMDNYSAGMLIGRHMLDLGHKHIAFISTTLNQVNQMRLRRLEGIRDVYALETDTSVRVYSRDITPQEELNDIEIEHRTGYELTLECIKKQENISGIVAVNDCVAYGVLDALSDNGLKVPDDYSVCGFDNLDFSRINSIKLTTVEHHIKAKGQNAFNILFSRIIGNSTVNNITRVEYPHYLLERQSTARNQKIS